MRLTRLKIRCLRNLQALDVAPALGLNLILGPNASGKTSLLEAIHLLSCGKSFRTHQLSQVVSRGSSGMTLSGEIADEAQGNSILGLEYEVDPGRLRVKVAGKWVQRLSELALYLPVVMIHQESHRIFTQGPEFRRSFLDWGLFHVEPLFLPAWQRYRRALRQRNSMLQQSLDRPEIWDRELVETGTVIHAQRQRYLQQFMPVFRGLLPLLRIDCAIDTRYRQGWSSEKDLAGQLADALPGDRRLGYTRFGPHRADIDFSADGVMVRERLSRGQMKVLVYALFLAQACTLAETTDRRCLILMDDLAAELDSDHIGQLIEKIRMLDFQTFITSSDTGFARYVGEGDRKLFHVEHGRLTEML